jgi:hypothetical protein
MKIKTSNMKTKSILVSLCFVASMASCSGQPKVFGESPLELENFDFNLNVKEFYPEKYRIDPEKWGWSKDSWAMEIPVNSSSKMQGIYRSDCTIGYYENKQNAIQE